MRVEKLLTVLALVFLAGALLVIAETGPATGYEISIYAAYPIYFWVLLVAGFTIGILILIRQAFSKGESKWWVAGLCIVLASNAILFLLPYFRGYVFFDRTDNLGAVGYAVVIENTGHLLMYDYYPSLHVLVTAMSLLSNISLYTISLILPPFLVCFYILGMILLSQVLNFGRREKLLIVALASIPFFQEQFMVVPRVVALDMLPFLLYLFFHSQVAQKPAFRGLFIVVLISLVFLHPLNGGILVVAVFILISASIMVYRWRYISTASEVSNGDFRVSLSYLGGVIMILLIIWFFWYRNFSVFYTLTQYLVHITDWTIPLGTQFLGIAQGASMTIADMGVIFLKLNGLDILYIAVAGLGTVYVMKHFLSQRSTMFWPVLAMVILFIVFTLLTFVVFLSPVSILKLDYTRILPYAILFSVIAIAWFLGSGNGWVSQRCAFWGIFLLCLVGLFFGISSLFPAPWTIRANPQITHAEIAGEIWFTSYQNGILPMDTVFNEYQALSSISGYAELASNILSPPADSAPPHFGYDKYANYGDAYAEDHYVLIPGFAYVYYPQAISEYPSSWVWTPNDFERLQTDTSLSLIYSDGGYQVFYLRGLAGGG